MWIPFKNNVCPLSLSNYPFPKNDLISAKKVATKRPFPWGVGVGLKRSLAEFHLSINYQWSETRGEMPASLCHSSLSHSSPCHFSLCHSSLCHSLLCHSSLWSLWLGSCKIAAAPHWRSPMLWKTVQHLLSGYFLPKTSNVRRNSRLALAMALNDLENDNIWILHVAHRHLTESDTGISSMVQRVENLSISL